MTIKTSKREWANIEEYQEELSGTNAILHDLLLSNATLSAVTIRFLLNQIEAVGEYIGTFPTSHPVFKVVAQNPNLNRELADFTILLSRRDPEVISAVASNPVLSEAYRITLALSGDAISVKA